MTMRLFGAVCLVALLGCDGAGPAASGEAEPTPDAATVEASSPSGMQRVLLSAAAPDASADVMTVEASAPVDAKAIEVASEAPVVDPHCAAAPAPVCVGSVLSVNFCPSYSHLGHQCAYCGGTAGTSLDGCLTGVTQTVKWDGGAESCFEPTAFCVVNCSECND
jgi:hypothetical protein